MPPQPPTAPGHSSARRLSRSSYGRTGDGRGSCARGRCPQVPGRGPLGPSPPGGVEPPERPKGACWRTRSGSWVRTQRRNTDEGARHGPAPSRAGRERNRHSTHRSPGTGVCPRRSGALGSRPPRPPALVCARPARLPVTLFPGPGAAVPGPSCSRCTDRCCPPRRTAASLQGLPASPALVTRITQQQGGWAECLRPGIGYATCPINWLSRLAGWRRGAAARHRAATPWRREGRNMTWITNGTPARAHPDRTADGRTADGRTAGRPPPHRAAHAPPPRPRDRSHRRGRGRGPGRRSPQVSVRKAAGALTATRPASGHPGAPGTPGSAPAPSRGGNPAPRRRPAAAHVCTHRAPVTAATPGGP